MKRFVISTLTAALLLATAAQALGEAVDLDQTNVSPFQDWNAWTWWAKSGGMRYAARGYIVGREGPTVAATDPVTEAEFATVLVRACLSQSDIDK